MFNLVERFPDLRVWSVVAMRRKLEFMVSPQLRWIHSLGNLVLSSFSLELKSASSLSICRIMGHTVGWTLTIAWGWQVSGILCMPSPHSSHRSVDAQALSSWRQTHLTFTASSHLQAQKSLWQLSQGLQGWRICWGWYMSFILTMCWRIHSMKWKCQFDVNCGIWTLLNWFARMGRLVWQADEQSLDRKTLRVLLTGRYWIWLLYHQCSPVHVCIQPINCFLIISLAV